MTDQFKPRHPLLVLIWGFGLLIVLSVPQLFGLFTGALFGGLSLGSFAAGKETNPDAILGRGIGAAVIGIPFAFLMIRYLWRRSLDWMRLRFNFAITVLGLLLGIALTLIIVGIIGTVADVQITADPSRFSGGALAKMLIGNLLMMTMVGITEESAFRGMVIREWATRWGWLVASLAGGLYFGVMHIGGISHPTIVSILQVIIAATAVTLLFVALYVRSHSLWLSIGFHIGWNFSLISLLGTPMSGNLSSYSLYQLSISGSDVWTGGEFGIESSVITIVTYLAVAWACIKLFRFGKPLLASSAPNSN
jgi:membrane protease YdiL (CAAX protease family)